MAVVLTQPPYPLATEARCFLSLISFAADVGFAGECVRKPHVRKVPIAAIHSAYGLAESGRTFRSWQSDQATISSGAISDLNQRSDPSRTFRGSASGSAYAPDVDAPTTASSKAPSGPRSLV